jgi:hypothetical protein
MTSHSKREGYRRRAPRGGPHVCRDNEVLVETRRIRDGSVLRVFQCLECAETRTETAGPDTPPRFPPPPARFG